MFIARPISPVSLATYNDKGHRDAILYPYAAVKIISARETGLDLLDDFKRNSVDFYATARSAYLQNRSKIPTCGVIEQPNYDFDFNMDDEE